MRFFLRWFLWHKMLLIVREVALWLDSSQPEADQNDNVKDQGLKPMAFAVEVMLFNIVLHSSTD